MLSFVIPLRLIPLPYECLHVIPTSFLAFPGIKYILSNEVIVISFRIRSNIKDMSKCHDRLTFFQVQRETEIYERKKTPRLTDRLHKEGKRVSRDRFLPASSDALSTCFLLMTSTPCEGEPTPSERCWRRRLTTPFGAWRRDPMPFKPSSPSLRATLQGVCSYLYKCRA